MSVGFSAGDVLALAQIAWDVHQACRKAPSEYLELQNELRSLQDALDSVGRVLERRKLDNADSEALFTIFEGCRNVLSDLRRALHKHSALGSSKKRLLIKLKWAKDDVSSYRNTLHIQSQALLLFMSGLTNSSSTNADIQLSNIVKQLQAMQLSQEQIQNSMALASQLITYSPSGLHTTRLETLVIQLIPEFFLPESSPSVAAWFDNPWSLSIFKNATIERCWGRGLHFEWKIDSSMSEVEGQFASNIGLAMSQFISRYPDKEYFRNSLLRPVGFLCTRNPAKTTVAYVALSAGIRFMMLALLMSHPPRIQVHLESPTRVLARAYDQFCDYVDMRWHYVLSLMLQHALEQALSGLDEVILGGKAPQEDWIVICLTICVVCFGVESTQVDAHLSEDGAQIYKEYLDGAAISHLSKLLAASTGDINPLWLDWQDEENFRLINNDPNARDALKMVQITVQRYDSLTGAMVSRVFLERKFQGRL